MLLPEVVTDQALSSIGVQVFIPYEAMNIGLAQLFSANHPAKNPTIAQIGVGALGSQLCINLIKSGFGIWKLIDDDIILPHNTVRHYLDQRYLGGPKSIVLANIINQSFVGGGMAEAFWDDYLDPLDRAAMDQALQKSSIILDTSASIPVARELAHRKDLLAKRISVFLNPRGTDLVVLAEDKDRTFPLDILEFQYYRALLDHPSLQDHLLTPDRIRYANSCRDVTSRLPQDLVALHAAIGASALKKYAESDNVQITIWHSTDQMVVERIDIPLHHYEIIEIEGWRVCIDQHLINIVSEARLSRLPNETGGILIGGHDFHNKIIYLVDMIPSPPDSEESKTGYVRGIEGVKEELEFIHSKTANHLHYAGEWHSHPENCPPAMSNDDTILFAELKEKMGQAGYPTLMLIAADDQQIAIYVS